MTEEEQVLAEVAALMQLPDGQLNRDVLKAKLAPYLPKPDRLTVAAIKCIDVIDDVEGDDTLEAIRAIIARVTPAAPSDEAIRLRDALQQIAEFYTDTDLAAKHMVAIARVALKGAGA